MKRLVFTVCCCLAAAAATGADAVLGGLPRGEFADTEAATNVPFAFHRTGVRGFRFELEFASTPSAAATTNSSKRLEWNLGMKRMRMQRLDVRENGVALFPELVDSPEPWFYSPDWNILRLTARGVDASAESAGVSLDVTGYTINLR